MNNFKNNSTVKTQGLITKFFIVTTALICVLLVFFALVLGYINYNKSISEQLLKNRNLAEIGKISLEDPIWTMANTGIENIGDAIFSANDIIALEILSEK
ncbi:MAG: hypothetical protein HQK53_16730, partial [Oligoflexia bacterium]|nr:hypothetical protein [Oligoflexia bacterium]